MKILIVAATWLEVRLLADELEFTGNKYHNLKCYYYKQTEIDILISGIGTTFTTFHLTQTLLNETYFLVINIGIGRSFNTDLKIGQVVNVLTEEFADLGVEGRNGFQTLFDAGFIRVDEFPFKNGVINNITEIIPMILQDVRGITTNRSNGREASINELFEKFDGQIESMEGAAVFFVCKWLKVPFYEIRAISNYVEPTGSSKWDIPLALQNLNTTMLKVFQDIEVEAN